MTIARVLSVNANCDAQTQEKPARQLIDETLAGLIRDHDCGLMLIQEYRFKPGAGGSSFNKFSPLRDLLPGGWRRWKVTQLEFEVPGMVPLILWDDNLWEGTAVKLAPAPSPPTPGSLRKGPPVEEPFAGRYSAALMTSRASKDKLLVVAYHGQFLVSKDSQQELNEDAKLANAQAFLCLVGSWAANAGVPALIGGDWSTSFGFEGHPVPTSEDWAVQLRPVSIYHPSDLDCYRYRNNKAPVDFLAVVNPTDRVVTLEAAGVTAVAHPAELQQFFDHDPLLASFTLSHGLESVIPPPPILAAAEAAAAVATPGRPTLPRRKSRPPTPPVEIGALAEQNDALQRQLEWLKREASGASGLGENAGGEEGVAGLQLAVEGSGSCSGYQSGGEEGGKARAGGSARAGDALAAGAAAAGEGGSGEEWQSLASQLLSELALVKEAAGELLEQKNQIIRMLQEKLRTISDEAAEGAAMPAAEPVPPAFLSKEAPFTPDRTNLPQAAGGHGVAWPSPAGSTNGR